ncbi:hypothetical protein LWI29_007883 [Acer saccharum]|uniref:LysM domain-containing protein n=1 Tax=Acer saccharum TaxID=4024 RepID=A0AA39S6D4_ACESA|nr:hypothetical protein LWI29_007883 [Acer saccharum]
MIEPCKTSDSCPSLLSYLVPYDSKLSEIAYRFQVNVLDILGANSINVPTNTQLDSLENQIVRAKSLIKVPISCPCVDGIRRSLSTAYVVKPADTLDSISEGFGGLVSDEQIRSVNGIISKKNPLRGESLGDICQEFGTTVSDLEAVNGLEQPLIDPGDILQLPIPVCYVYLREWKPPALIYSAKDLISSSEIHTSVKRPSAVISLLVFIEVIRAAKFSEGVEDGDDDDNLGEPCDVEGELVLEEE